MNTVKMPNRKFPKFIYLLVCFVLVFQQSGFAQVAVELNIASRLTALHNSFVADKFRPVHLRYLQYLPQNNSFKLLLDKGDAANATNSTIATNATKDLLNYFFIGLTLPNDSFWVNLRPDSPDNIIDDYLAKTDVGKIMLEADLELKKDTALATSPATPEGREYWNKLYTKAGELFGSENITIPTLTRPWIVPDEIIIRETMQQGLSPLAPSQAGKGTVPDSAPSAYIYKATLKVMLESDYLNSTNSAIVTNPAYQFKDDRLRQLNEYSSQLIRELIIPKLTKEINTSKRYAPLRQAYYSLILAQWFKARFKPNSTNSTNATNLANRIDSRNLTNLISKEPWSKTTYFQAYQKSFKDGEYNIKEPVYTPTGQVIRSYFSGGMMLISPDLASALTNPTAKAGNVMVEPTVGELPVVVSQHNSSPVEVKINDSVAIISVQIGKQESAIVSPVANQSSSSAMESKTETFTDSKTTAYIIDKLAAYIIHLQSLNLPKNELISSVNTWIGKALPNNMISISDSSAKVLTQWLNQKGNPQILAENLVNFSQRMSAARISVLSEIVASESGPLDFDIGEAVLDFTASDHEVTLLKRDINENIRSQIPIERFSFIDDKTITLNFDVHDWIMAGEIKENTLWSDQKLIEAVLAEYIGRQCFDAHKDNIPFFVIRDLNIDLLRNTLGLWFVEEFCGPETLESYIRYLYKRSDQPFSTDRNLAIAAIGLYIEHFRSLYAKKDVDFYRLISELSVKQNLYTQYENSSVENRITSLRSYTFRDRLHDALYPIITSKKDRFDVGAEHNVLDWSNDKGCLLAQLPYYKEGVAVVDDEQFFYSLMKRASRKMSVLVCEAPVSGLKSFQRIYSLGKINFEEDGYLVGRGLAKFALLLLNADEENNLFHFKPRGKFNREVTLYLMNRIAVALGFKMEIVNPETGIGGIVFRIKNEEGADLKLREGVLKQIKTLLQEGDKGSSKERPEKEIVISGLNQVDLDGSIRSGLNLLNLNEKALLNKMSYTDPKAFVERKGELPVKIDHMLVRKEQAKNEIYIYDIYGKPVVIREWLGKFGYADETTEANIQALERQEFNVKILQYLTNLHNSISQRISAQAAQALNNINVTAVQQNLIYNRNRDEIRVSSPLANEDNSLASSSLDATVVVQNRKYQNKNPVIFDTIDSLKLWVKNNLSDNEEIVLFPFWMITSPKALNKRDFLDVLDWPEYKIGGLPYSRIFWNQRKAVLSTVTWQGKPHYAILLGEVGSAPSELKGQVTVRHFLNKPNSQEKLESIQRHGLFVVGGRAQFHTEFAGYPEDIAVVFDLPSEHLASVAQNPDLVGVVMRPEFMGAQLPDDLRRELQQRVKFPLKYRDAEQAQVLLLAEEAGFLTHLVFKQQSPSSTLLSSSVKKKEDDSDLSGPASGSPAQKIVSLPSASPIFTKVDKALSFPTLGSYLTALERLAEIPRNSDIEKEWDERLNKIREEIKKLLPLPTPTTPIKEIIADRLKKIRETATIVALPGHERISEILDLYLTTNVNQVLPLTAESLTSEIPQEEKKTPVVAVGKEATPPVSVQDKNTQALRSRDFHQITLHLFSEPSANLKEALSLLLKQSVERQAQFIRALNINLETAEVYHKYRVKLGGLSNKEAQEINGRYGTALLTFIDTVLKEGALASEVREAAIEIIESLKFQELRQNMDTAAAKQYENIRAESITTDMEIMAGEDYQVEVSRDKIVEAFRKLREEILPKVRQDIKRQGASLLVTEPETYLITDPILKGLKGRLEEEERENLYRASTGRKSIWYSDIFINEMARAKPEDIAKEEARLLKILLGPLNEEFVAKGLQTKVREDDVNLFSVIGTTAGGMVAILKHLVIISKTSDNKELLEGELDDKLQKFSSVRKDPKALSAVIKAFDGIRNQIPSGNISWYEEIRQRLIDLSKGSSPVISDNDTKGGIDFRSLPIVTQAMSNLRLSASSAISLSQLNALNLNQELQEMQKLVEAGITPSTQRIMEYVASSCLKEEKSEKSDSHKERDSHFSSDMQKVVSCIADILRLEEERCYSTEPILKDILVVLESGMTNQELRAVFTGVR